MFDPLPTMLLGLLTGILFGFFLQKGRVGKFETIVGQFLLRDWTVVKVMATAVAVGSAGVWGLISISAATLHLKPAIIAGVIVGGVLFGVGMAVLGYCPGTTVAACGEGRRDAMVGLAGMFVGALVYVLAYPAVQPFVKSWGDLGKIGLPQVTSTSPWLWIIGLLGIAAAVDFWRVRRLQRL